MMYGAPAIGFELARKVTLRYAHVRRYQRARRNRVGTEPHLMYGRSLMEPRLGRARLPGIDTLRGLSALYVLAFHVALIPPALHVPTFLQAFVVNGASGVILFYILSAFTLAHTWRSRRAQPFRFQYLKYLKRRFLRIAPLYYLMLVIYLIYVYCMFGKIYNWDEILINLTFTHNFFPGYHESIVWGGWSIGVEMVFYLILPLLVNRGLTLRYSFLLVLCSLIGAAIFRIAWTRSNPVTSSYLYMSLLNQLPVFALGLLCYGAFLSMSQSGFFRRGSIAAALLVAGVWLFIYAAILYPASGSVTSFLQSPIPFISLLELEALGLGLVVLSVALRPPRWVVNRFTVFLGKISFSLYLCHPLLVHISRPLSMRMEEMIGPWGFVPTVLVTLLVLVPLATLTYHVVERPFINQRAFRVCREPGPMPAIDPLVEPVAPPS
jgi:peptidoglycan/LPS O-acetylase OafA/YrhL